MKEPVTVVVSRAFFDEMRPWHEDRLSDGETVDYDTRRGGRVYAVTCEREIALDLLDFAEHGADAWRSGGGMDMGDWRENGRMARMYNAASKSLHRQLHG